MRGRAPLFRRQKLPTSLMHRLDLLQHLALEAAARAEGRMPGALVVYRPPPPPRPRLGAQAIVLAWFSLGVLTSGAIGAGTFYGLRAIADGGPLMTWAAWAKPPSAASVPSGDGRWNEAQWEAAEVTIDRSEQGHARLPLEVMGADAGPVKVLLQGVPAGVRLSRGQPLGASDWVLTQSDLADLHLALDDTTPKVFDVRVAVLAPAGVATVGSIVQVRVVDTTARTQDLATNGADAATADSAKSTPQAPAAAQASIASGSERANGASPRRRSAVPAAGVTEVAPVASGRSWPEGASGLGAVARESERQVWWEMPPPAWSPFQDRQATP